MGIAGHEALTGQVMRFLALALDVSTAILERHETVGFGDYGDALRTAIDDDEFARTIESRFSALMDQPAGQLALDVLSEELSAAHQNIGYAYEMGFWGKLPDILDTILGSIASLFGECTAGRIIIEAIQECAKIARARLDQ